ncbi:hypothetical protein GALMADRAFT_1083899 [Galerina marginata CBS 339.88]|uniref:Uncharacterized protein n=1 Tax=Galerina marginata (strain CBS 339.88) TaxID=685588 RepID=A0A067S905_GALM3|nr:hypothetical protein GALMADRAFT_1083899 [Galerina marginata CBS 339.88]
MLGLAYFVSPRARLSHQSFVITNEQPTPTSYRTEANFTPPIVAAVVGGDYCHRPRRLPRRATSAVRSSSLWLPPTSSPPHHFLYINVDAFSDVLGFLFSFGVIGCRGRGRDVG